MGENSAPGSGRGKKGGWGSEGPEQVLWVSVAQVTARRWVGVIRGAYHPDFVFPILSSPRNLCSKNYIGYPTPNNNHPLTFLSHSRILSPRLETQKYPSHLDPRLPCTPCIKVRQRREEFSCGSADYTLLPPHQSSTNNQIFNLNWLLQKCRILMLKATLK